MIWPWVALLAGSLLWQILNHPRRLQLWQDAAAACGLSVVEVACVWPVRWKLAAEAGPVHVRIEDKDSRGNGTRIAVVVPGPPGFSAVRIRRELGRPGVSEIDVGDEAFDRTFSIEGPMRLVCVLLDEEARRLLRKVNLKSWVEIAGGELRAETSADKVAEVLPLLLDLGRRFAQKLDVVQGLVDNVRRDPKAGVRLNNLLLLVRECARGPRTEEVLRGACSDRSPEVRLRAALELGAEGRSVLLELADSMKDDDCSAQAIRALGRELPLERAIGIINKALRRRRIQTACACLEALGTSGTAEAVDTLAKVLAREEGELAIAAAQALGMVGSTPAEPPLILALRRGKIDIRVAAAKALGHVGSAAAVLPLKEASDPFPAESDLDRAARQAIAEIQSRLPGASPGQLSLAGAEVGQLSLAEAGQLSLATDAAGQLSLSSAEPGQLSLSAGEEELKPAPSQERLPPR